MGLDAGKAIEARTKEVQYIRDKRVQQALSKGWNIIKKRLIDINVMMRIQCTEAA